MKIIQSGKQGVAFNRVLSVSSALLLRNQKNSLHWNPSSKYLGTISQYNGRLLTTVYSLRIYALPMLEIKKPCSKQTNTYAGRLQTRPKRAASGGTCFSISPVKLTVACVAVISFPW